MEQQIYNFRNKILPNLKLNPDYKADALQQINSQVKAGILGEKENLTHNWMTRVVNRMDQLKHYLMRYIIITPYNPPRPVFTHVRTTTLGHEFLILSPFASKGYGGIEPYSNCTATEKHIILTLGPVGVNGVKREKDPKAIEIYVENLGEIFRSLTECANFWIRLDCLTGPFNELCLDYLEKNYGINPNNTYAATKRHTKEYYDNMLQKMSKYSKEFGWENHLHSWISGYVKKPAWKDPNAECKLLGNFMHKYGDTRWAPGLDLLGEQQAPKELKKKCKEHFFRTGRPAIVVAIDDSVSAYSCSAKNIVNQLGPYATVILIAAMFEF
jgi:hypothetical protein